MNWLGAHVVFDRDSLLPTLVKAAAILVVVGILAGSCAFLSRGSPQRADDHDLLEK